MKFGQRLKENAFPEWKYYYLDYDECKRALKSGNFDEQQEQDFVQRLESELEKVFGKGLIQRLLRFER